MSDRSPFGIDGALAELDDGARARLVDRALDTDPALAASVAQIVAAVAERGDAALRELATRYDAVELDHLEVDKNAWKEALERTPEPLRDALRTARARIAAFHRRQLPATEEVDNGDGTVLGRRPEPLARVGVYAPGGRAAYPSSVLMGVVPAKIAGVDEVVVCSPPGESGAPPDAVLAACEIAGADRLFAIGGAGAVAALAYGTASIPRADKVVGPGNAYVTEAKRQLAGRLDSDCFAGPSELLVVCDESADAEMVARELIAQAEHDPQAVVVAVATTRDLADTVRGEVARQAAALPRGETIEQALRDNGALLVADRDAALEFAGRFAPEHLLLLVDEPRRAMAAVRGAGSIFLGPSSSVVFGDYASGTNHVLPTGGRGRSQSGLSTLDFVRWSTYQEIDARGAAALAPVTETLASSEGLEGHAAAARALSDGSGADVTARRAPLPRPGYAELSTYDPGRAPIEVDLTDNTNLFGQPPAAADAFARLTATDVRGYPSLYGGELKEAAAAYFDVPPECIATGCGSDDLIDSTVRAYCAPGDGLAYARPTFSMIESFARMNGARPIAVDLASDFELDPGPLVAAGAAVTYVCRPNNPTGNAFAREAVEELVEATSNLVIIDEAYGDFCEHPLAGWAPSVANAVVLRTLSKAFGLAGLRVGLAIGDPRVINEIEKSRGPYKVGVAAEAVAAAALRDDADWVASTVAEAVAAREQLAAALAELGLETYPSDANFLLVAAPNGSAVDFARRLAEGGVGVRPFAGLPQAGDCVRVTVGPQPLMTRFLARVGEVIEP